MGPGRLKLTSKVATWMARRKTPVLCLMPPANSISCRSSSICSRYPATTTMIESWTRLTTPPGGKRTAQSVPSSADGNGDGVVDAADYVIWRTAMAANSGSGSSLAISQSFPGPPGAVKPIYSVPDEDHMAVPEPSSTQLGIIAALVACSGKAWWPRGLRRERARAIGLINSAAIF